MRAIALCLLVGCGSAPRSGTAPAAAGSPASRADLGIRADRTPVAVRPLERSARLAPEPVEYVPALTTLPYEGDDIDEQIAMRKRLLAAEGGDGVVRVEQWVAIASLYIQKGETNRAERAYISATAEPSFSEYDHADEVLFRAATLLRKRGELLQARKLVQQLIVEFPTSSWISDAYVQFGDHFFGADRRDVAEKFYAKAVELGEERTVGYARYKLGWCHLERGDRAAALEQFALASRDSAGRGPDLARAALRGFVYAYPGVGRPDRAYPALRRLDADAAGAMFAWLGELYAAGGKADEAKQVFAQLGELVDAGKVGGIAVSEAFSARARAALIDGRTDRAEAYVARFPDATDAGEMTYYLADAAWRRAAGAADPGVAAELWERTASLFERAVDGGGLTDSQITDAEAAATVARHNAAAARSARK